MTPMSFLTFYCNASNFFRHHRALFCMTDKEAEVLAEDVLKIYITDILAVN